MAVTQQRSIQETLGAFEEYLRRVAGVSTRAGVNYARFVDQFLKVAFPDGQVDMEAVTAAQVADFIRAMTDSSAAATVALAASSLRSFFRFTRLTGLRGDRLEDAVPMVPRRRSGLVRHLDSAQFERLIASLEVSSPRGLRDKAMILLMARLGLRASEVTRLRLDDIDWDAGVVTVTSRKSGHGARLPLTHEVGGAVGDYLRDGRPDTASRQVFVAHRIHRGAPVSGSVVGRAVDHALGRAGIAAPIRGANLMRHSLATDLLAHGATLHQIADLLGHRSLATTRIYAAVDVTALRQVTLPWPATSPPRSSWSAPSPRPRRHSPRVAGPAVVASGPMAALAADYQGLRRGLGYRSATAERALRAFARYLDSLALTGGVPLEVSLDWAAGGNSRDPHNPARRLATVRGFLRYLAARDSATQVPPPGLLGSVGPRRAPHVYSDAEVGDLLAAAAHLPPADGLRPCCYATLFGLLACTGLRVSEALALTCADVDLAGAMITVRAGKRGLTRLVPLHPTALGPLGDYLAARTARYGPPGPDETFFFRTDRADRVSYSAAHATFTGLRTQMGWSPQGRTRLPRIHDLRHKMVVARILAWHAEGQDVDAKIAVLATYLGHIEVRDVYWYLSAVPELMSLVADRFETFAATPPSGAS